MLAGGVSASAPFGTNDNMSNTGAQKSNKYGSKVSPFGTDDNEYNRNLPMNDHRQNGKSMNTTQARTFKKNDKQEVKQHTSNVILALREKLVKRGVRSWFNLHKNFKM